MRFPSTKTATRVLLGLCLVAATGAEAQQRRDAARPAPGVVRYVTFSPATLGGLIAEGWVRETRQRGKLVEASLELCFQPAPPSRRRDRLSIPLSVEADRLTGQGRTAHGGEALAVDLKRRVEEDMVMYSGRVAGSSGGWAFESSGSFEVDEQGFRDAEDAAPPLLTHAETTLDAAPGTVRVIARREGLATLVETLRTLQATVDAAFFEDACADLRKGVVAFDATLDPFRRDAALKTLKAHPSVKEAGLAPQEGEALSAMRFPGAAHREADGAPKLEALAGIIRQTAATALPAGGMVEVSPDPANAAIRVKVRLPNAERPMIAAFDVIDMTLVTFPDAQDATRLALSRVATRTRVESAGAADRPGISGGDYAFDPDGFTKPFWTALAKALGGEMAAADGSGVWETP